ncbi:sugar ABC transporter permease [Candidatus Chlorohelix sp.]|uniref:carbohydrate ABC transporter permease n=1 Tax=Candidatus Chlorohelix sp. TaxID=3139201 RepID=UPI00303D2D66
MEQESKQALIEAKNADSTLVAFKANASRKSLGRAIFPYLLIFPTLALITLFTFIPTINSAIQSTIKPPRTVQQEAEFVGFKNYLDLFDNNTVIGQEDNFQRVFVNTLVFVAVTVPVCVILAFLLALLLNQKLKLTSIYRTGIFYPVLLPLLSAASIWAFFFADSFGMLNTTLKAIGLPPQGWNRDANWALISIMLVVIWKQTGFYMIFYLAGLQNLPQDIYEAAQLDGASALRRMFNLTIPLLNGTTLFVLVIAGVGAFQTADPLYALGEGNPANRSNLILYFIYQHLNEPRDRGYVYAMTILLLILLLVFTVFNFIFIERRANYED